MLEHHDAGMRIDDLEEALGRDVRLRGLRIVLVNHRNFLAQRRDHVGEVGHDLRFRLEAGQRRDHDAAGTGVHGDLAELDEVCGARVRHADDHRHPAVDPAQEITRELGRFLVAELLGLAHHAEHGQAVNAALQIELDQTVDARPVDFACIGERRCRDRVHALCGRIEELAHVLTFLGARNFQFAENALEKNVYPAYGQGQPMRADLRCSGLARHLDLLRRAFALSGSPRLL